MQLFRRIILVIGAAVIGLLILGFTTSVRNTETIHSAQYQSQRMQLDSDNSLDVREQHRNTQRELNGLSKQVEQLTKLLQKQGEDNERRESSWQEGMKQLKETALKGTGKGPELGLGAGSRMLQGPRPARISQQTITDATTHIVDVPDDNSTAQELYKRVRVLCYLPITDDTVNTLVPHILATWGKRCNKILFFANNARADYPVVGLGLSNESGSYDLSAKMFESYYYIYRHHLNEYDWFIKADTDTYVIMENLRYLLKDYKSSEPIFFGHHFKARGHPGYMSGGAGYVMSREALRRFGELGYKKSCVPETGAEDWEIGSCLATLHVRPGDHRDKYGRGRFHCFTPGDHIQGFYPKWYFTFDMWGSRQGPEVISNYAISFHFLTVDDLHMMEFYVYQLRPYGHHVGLAPLNRDRNAPAPPTPPQPQGTRQEPRGARQDPQGASAHPQNGSLSKADEQANELLEKFKAINALKLTKMREIDNLDEKKKALNDHMNDYYKQINDVMNRGKENQTN